MSNTAVAEIQDQFLELDPKSIVTESNIRYGLKQSRIDSLRLSVLQEGRFLQPVEVQEYDDNGNKLPEGTYLLNTGNYRLATALLLDKEFASDGGVKLPAIVVAPISKKDRVRRQLAENREREDMSPIDIGTAVQSMLNEGYSRLEIRQLFARPSGSKKSGKTEPASNAFINMMVSFLSFPKPIQNKIHSGEINVAGAYALSRAKREKWDDIIARIEREREAEAETERKDEERWAAEQKKEEERNKKSEELAATHKETSTKLETLTAKAAELAQEEITKFTELTKVKVGGDKETISKAEAELKASQEQAKANLKALEDAKKEEAKLAAKLETAKKEAAERAEKLKLAKKNAEKNAKAKKAAIGPGEVQKAAKAEGAENNYVPLKVTDIRKGVSDLCLPGVFPKVRDIAKAMNNWISGVTTANDLYTELAIITGEKTAKGKKLTLPVAAEDKK